MLKQPPIVMVVGVDVNYAIGKNGGLPWKVPYDMRVFRHITENNPVIMGRKTWDSLDKPLIRRTNIIISSSHDQSLVGDVKNSHPIFVASTLQEAKTRALESIDLHREDNHEPSIMVIGGSQIFELFAPEADEIFISHLNLTVDNPDSFFDKSWLNHQHRRHETRSHLASKSGDDLVDFTLDQYLKIGSSEPSGVNSVFSLDFFQEKDLNDNVERLPQESPFERVPLRD